MRNRWQRGPEGEPATNRGRETFGASSVDVWKEIAALAPAQTYSVGTILFNQDFSAREAYLIQQGLVKLMRLEDEGQPVIIGLRSPGWLLGAASVILQRPHPVTAETLTRCHVCRIWAGDLRRLMKTDDGISWYLHQMHSREVYDQVAQVAGLGGLSARHRLEHFLWELSAAEETVAPQTSIRLQLPLKQWELAQLIAVTPQYLSELFKRLERDGVIRRNKGWLIISDPHKLWHRSEY